MFGGVFGIQFQVARLIDVFWSGRDVVLNSTTFQQLGMSFLDGLTAFRQISRRLFLSDRFPDTVANSSCSNKNQTKL